MSGELTRSMLRRMTRQDIDQVTRIHMTSWDKNTLLTKMGSFFLRECFYGQIVDSNQTFGYVFCEGDKIIGYATGFFDYPAFIHNNPKNWIGRLMALWNILTCKLTWKDILDALNDSRKYRALRDSEFHLGALALRNEYKGTPQGKRAITTCISAVLKDIKDFGANSVWGITDKQNIPMQKYLYRFSFELVEEIKFRNRSELVFEKVF